MPIYEYCCECGKERGVKLSFKDAGQPQVCECGETMRKRISVPSIVMKSTGNQMALDTLNSDVVGGKRKAWAEQTAFEGTKKKDKVVF